jgi:hypothetical protein
MTRNLLPLMNRARATGIAQKSAWFVLQPLRFVLEDTRPVLMGEGEENPVEADECFIGQA